MTMSTFASLIPGAFENMLKTFAVVGIIGGIFFLGFFIGIGIGGTYERGQWINAAEKGLIIEHENKNYEVNEFKKGDNL